jgi:hypothetical protein
MKAWTFASSSGTGQYTATLADDGKLLCNCKGWTMRRGVQPRHCKHTKQIAAEVGGVVERGEFVFATAGAQVAPPVLPVSRPTVAAAPMLASAMTTRVTGVAFDAAYGDGDVWAMEEKLDGHRCTVVVRGGEVAAYSRPREGKANARALPVALVEQLSRFPDGTYDGELVAAGGKAWNVVELGARLVFVVFDVVGAGDYRQRRARLLGILQTCLTPDQTAVSTVESVVPSWAAIEAIWSRGGEGVIVKRLSSLYRPGHRSPDWLKVKQAHAATLTITGFEAGKSGPYSALKLRDAHGIDTTVKVLGNRMLADISAAPDTFVGRRVVIAYQEKTPSGTYRHGIFDHFAGVGE